MRARREGRDWHSLGGSCSTPALRGDARGMAASRWSKAPKLGVGSSVSVQTGAVNGRERVATANALRTEKH